MKEVWTDVKGFEGVYKISDRGNLKHYTKRFGWRTLKNTNKNGWYLNVVLRGDGFKKSVKIHRLVAEAFIPNLNHYKCINHIDMNKQNNRVENLEWCSYKENSQKAQKEKPEIVLGMINYNKFIKPKKIQQFSLDGKFISEYNNAEEASSITGVCARNILQVANKTPFNKRGSIRKQAGGFVWKFKGKEVV